MANNVNRATGSPDATTVVEPIVSKNISDGLRLFFESVIKSVVEATTVSVMHGIEELMENKKPKRQYTRDEVCAILRVTKATLNNWAKSGKLVPVKVGMRVLYDEDTINAFLNSNSHIKYKRV